MACRCTVHMWSVAAVLASVTRRALAAVSCTGLCVLVQLIMMFGSMSPRFMRLVLGEEAPINYRVLVGGGGATTKKARGGSMSRGAAAGTVGQSCGASRCQFRAAEGPRGEDEGTGQDCDEPRTALVPQLSTLLPQAAAKKAAATKAAETLASGETDATQSEPAVQDDLAMLFALEITRSPGSAELVRLQQVRSGMLALRFSVGGVELHSQLRRLIACAGRAMIPFPTYRNTSRHSFLRKRHPQRADGGAQIRTDKHSPRLPRATLPCTLQIRQQSEDKVGEKVRRIVFVVCADSALLLAPALSSAPPASCRMPLSLAWHGRSRSYWTSRLGS